ncbi:MAG: hypothetical protein AAF978_05265 [Cyanobacteria bacterium P01_E01_bin.48]
MKRAILFLLLAFTGAVGAVNLELQSNGPIDLGALQILLPKDVQIAIMKFESERDFCVGVQAVHFVGEEEVESNRFSKCWVAGEFNLMFKIEPLNEKRSWFRFGLNHLSGGGTVSGNTINVGGAFGASMRVPPYPELTGELNEILEWQLTVREGNDLIEHTVTVSAFMSENPNGAMGSGVSELVWPD